MGKDLCSVGKKPSCAYIWIFTGGYMYQEPQTWEIYLCLPCTCFLAARSKYSRSYSVWPQTSKWVLNVARPAYIFLPCLNPSHSPRQLLKLPALFPLPPLFELIMLLLISLKNNNNNNKRIKSTFPCSCHQIHLAAYTST